jgi:hypothetical protein
LAMVRSGEVEESLLLRVASQWSLSRQIPAIWVLALGIGRRGFGCDRDAGAVSGRGQVVTATAAANVFTCWIQRCFRSAWRRLVGVRPRPRSISSTVVTQMSGAPAGVLRLREHGVV